MTWIFPSKWDLEKILVWCLGMDIFPVKTTLARGHDGTQFFFHLEVVVPDAP
jgi:hypothetical protein